MLIVGLSLTSITEVFIAVLRLLRLVERGDERALERMKDILPHRSYTRLAQEAAKARNEAKYG